MAFETWQAEAAAGKHREAIMRSAVARMRHRTLYLAWKKWRDDAEERKILARANMASVMHLIDYKLPLSLSHWRLIAVDVREQRAVETQGVFRACRHYATKQEKVIQYCFEDWYLLHTQHRLQESRAAYSEQFLRMAQARQSWLCWRHQAQEVTRLQLFWLRQAWCGWLETYALDILLAEATRRFKVRCRVGLGEALGRWRRNTKNIGSNPRQQSLFAFLQWQQTSLLQASFASWLDQVDERRLARGTLHKVAHRFTGLWKAYRHWGFICAHQLTHSKELSRSATRSRYQAPVTMSQLMDMTIHRERRLLASALGKWRAANEATRGDRRRSAVLQRWQLHQVWVAWDQWRHGAAQAAFALRQPQSPSDSAVRTTWLLKHQRRACFQWWRRNAASASLAVQHYAFARLAGGLDRWLRSIDRASQRQHAFSWATTWWGINQVAAGMAHWKSHAESGTNQASFVRKLRLQLAFDALRRERKGEEPLPSPPKEATPPPASKGKWKDIGEYMRRDTSARNFDASPPNLDMPGHFSHYAGGTETERGVVRGRVSRSPSPALEEETLVTPETPELPGMEVGDLDEKWDKLAHEDFYAYNHTVEMETSPLSRRRHHRKHGTKQARKQLKIRDGAEAFVHKDGQVGFHPNVDINFEAVQEAERQKSLHGWKNMDEGRLNAMKRVQFRPVVVPGEEND